MTPRREFLTADDLMRYAAEVIGKLKSGEMSAVDADKACIRMKLTIDGVRAEMRRAVPK